MSLSCRSLLEESLSVDSLEYRYSQPGQYTPQELTFSSTEGNLYTVYYPEGTEGNLPVIFWGNGSWETHTTYSSLLRHFASWGFVVVGNEDTAVGTGEAISIMAEATRIQNDNPESPIYRLLNTDKMALAGHSQGAGGSVNAAYRYGISNLFRAVATAALPQISVADPEDVYDISKIDIPIFMVAGTQFLDSIISPRKAMYENFDAIVNSPQKVISRRLYTDHNEIQEECGGALGSYFTAWFLYQLTGDAEAGAVFSLDGELAGNKNWVDTRIEM